MINIDKAETKIKEAVTCKTLDKEITNEGVYLEFSNLEIRNSASINYFFNIYVALGSYSKDRTHLYKKLSDTLNEINKTDGKIELTACKPLRKDGNIISYFLTVKINILG